ncbi:hypothetical protein ES703_115914 [subsurface metagenome]
MVDPESGITAEDLLPMPPTKGPPLPRGFGLKWPGQDTMFFNVPEARQQLTSKGFVYTLRPKMRRIGKDTAFYGSYYKKEKIGDIFVDLIKEVKNPEEVKQYVSDSGFKTLEDWWEAAKGSRFLFKVTMKGE